MNRSWKARLIVLVVLAMAATALVALPALAENGPYDEGEVGTGAQIGTGGDDSPLIVCKWELPDADANANTGMQYGNDDTPQFGAGYPCDGVDPETYYSEGHVVIDVRANPEDQPTERYIELWAAVRGAANANDVDSVFWDIYHPDGTLKVQRHGHFFDGPAQSLGAYFDAGAGEYVLEPGGMWYAASDLTEQIAPDTARSQQGIIARVVQNDVQLWWQYFYLSKHQPCGPYLVEFYATYDGDTSWIHNFINVLCFVNLEVDFSEVNWGAITPGGTDWVYGDLNFEPDNSAYPTVKNTGSGSMGLSIVFSEMKRPEDQDPNTVKKIVDFDAAFGINPDFLYHGDVAAYDELYFGEDYHQVLCANEVGKLDLSIHPPPGLPAGDYVGELYLFAWHTYSGFCLNEAGVWNPPYVRFPIA